MTSLRYARNLRYDLLKSDEIRRYNGEFLQSIFSNLPYAGNRNTPLRQRRHSGCARLEKGGFASLKCACVKAVKPPASISCSTATFRMACCWSVNFTVSFILGVRCATVIPFAPYGSAIIAWTQKTLHPRYSILVLDSLASRRLTMRSRSSVGYPHLSLLVWFNSWKDILTLRGVYLCPNG